ncbi:Tn3 family transposase [Verminephrobacter aporrectodeae]|uniref:Tn3 family transposase n=3 Tax=Verminephrobacter aporrectodeae TaxID=1110389 RepID=UPI0022425DF6|nr:Tn3 family transposase [Verminephrobacter aporrectodeae]
MSQSPSTKNRKTQEKTRTILRYRCLQHPTRRPQPVNPYPSLQSHPRNPRPSAQIGHDAEMGGHARRNTHQLSALGLVVNMIVLWNTLYMDAVLTQLRSEGYPVKPEDEARLSPFGHEHINMLGRYPFSVPEAVARGELRTLNGGREES